MLAANACNYAFINKIYALYVRIGVYGKPLIFADGKAMDYYERKISFRYFKHND